MSEYNNGLDGSFGAVIPELQTVGDKAVEAIKQIDIETDGVKRELSDNTPKQTAD